MTTSTPAASAHDPLSDGQYSRLLQFRTSLRIFLHWSEQQAKAVGITPAQYQLLLAVKGHPGSAPTVGDLAGYLLLRHHSTGELLDRACRAGFVERVQDSEDGRVARAHLTPAGEDVLARLVRVHLEEIRRLGPMLAALDEVDDIAP